MTKTTQMEGQHVRAKQEGRQLRTKKEALEKK